MLDGFVLFAGALGFFWGGFFCAKVHSARHHQLRELLLAQ